MSTTTSGVIGSGSNILVDPFVAFAGNGYQIEWEKVPDTYRTNAFSVVINGAVLAGVTSLTVDPLTAALMSGMLINYGAAGQVRVAAAAAAGATTVTVDAIPANIADNAVGTAYSTTAPKMLPAGLAVGKAGSTNGKMIFPRVVTTNPAIGLLKEDVVQGNLNSALTGVGVWESGFFWENRLPDAVANGGTLASAIKTELGARFAYKTAENNATAYP
jgi:hypothetical protein